jgi:hypothetical protein
MDVLITEKRRIKPEPWNGRKFISLPAPKALHFDIIIIINKKVIMAFREKPMKGTKTKSYLCRKM